MLGVIFLFEWLILSINVHDRQAWLLENLLVIISVPYILWVYSKRFLSEFSLFLIFIFMSLHLIGAHYTYSLVPYDEWTYKYTGLFFNKLMGWERNNYDRIIHFMWGLLLYYPFVEILKKKTRLSYSRIMILSILIIIGSSSVYELLEWCAAVVFGGDVGQAYIGTQGDEWDSQKDQALALAGAVMAASLNQILKSKSGIWHRFFGKTRKNASSTSL